MRDILLLAFISLLGGCASPQMSPGSATISTAELLSGGVLTAGAAVPPEQDMLALTPQMREFVDRHINVELSPIKRWDALVAAISTPGMLDLEYSDDTLSAADAFSTRIGNCLSHSALLIALARYAGIRADFHEVDVPPDWTNRAGVLIRWQHINVLVDLGPHGQFLLDFETAGDTSGFPGEVVSDTRAAAHFFNNLGVEQLQAGNVELAMTHFRRSLAEEPDFLPAWNNLGALYRQQGYPRHAEAAYLHTLTLDGGDLTAMSNLVRLYELEGDDEAAADYRTRVDRYRNSNPYYHFGMAQQAFDAGRLEQAERHLRNALRRKRDEHRFHLLQARLLEARGEASRAEKARRHADMLIASSI